ncbi:uncharacterized protein BP5553_09491 [Venustampulla echinocandica]|uniref:Uncharacterized protein n=1 Tax=Venustampulla echinocandica TaxID=2656787 RepID=A0A370TCU9_9HELO|nr:uncharacterized protein BP5553_09491 [Venustampulla echinocandica]RDL32089.1 hypothetical protein BP5553_09491 [Venustampulla echinocandica]
MKPSILLPISLLPYALASPHKSRQKSQILSPDVPIYIGHVFWPPKMTFIAWLPSPSDDKYTPQTEWCYFATDASNHKLFHLGGIGNLQIKNYFDEEAYIARDGKRWADCRVTPESGRMGACTGVEDWECEGGHKFTGPGTKGWSCWVNDKEALLKELEGPIANATQGGEPVLTTSGVAMGTMDSSSLVGAFTPGATGS